MRLTRGLVGDSTGICGSDNLAGLRRRRRALAQREPADLGRDDGRAWRASDAHVDHPKRGRLQRRRRLVGQQGGERQRVGGGAVDPGTA